MGKVSVGCLLVFTWASVLFASADVESFFDAISEGDLARVESLLAEGVDVNASIAGITALMVVKDVEIAELLIAAGADVNAVYEKDGSSVLHIAAGRHCNAELVRVLIEAGADVNAKRPGTYVTPLDYAVGCAFGTGDTSVHEVLLAHGGEGELFHQLWEAEQEDRKRDAERERQRKVGTTTPLHTAVIDGTLAEVSTLIEAGADVDAISEDGETPLHLAVIATVEAYDEDGPAKVELLIEAGANLEVADHYGYRPIHLVAESFGNNALAVLQLLIDAGADVNAETEDGGRTPLALARNLDIKELLQASGGKK